MLKVLIFGYGNPDRQDDGVSWHILRQVAEHIGDLPLPASCDEEFANAKENVTFLYDLQLTPDKADYIAGFDRVIFVDAHTGAVPEELHDEVLTAQYQKSPFTHHMTPQTLLSFAQSLYGAATTGRLISVRGYEFGFSNELSPRTKELAAEAAGLILKYLE
ncbi:MAG TPA: hydrogenase maturation protease [Longilinea sp.]|nr:hydrogenase maturation protease [Longilinea sp.]